MAIIISEAKTTKDIKSFVKFQRKLYKDNAYYVPPIDRLERNFFSSKNPMAEDCEFKLWIARENKKIVGRIAGIINHKYNSDQGKKQVSFTHFDCINNKTVAHQLFETVEDWAKTKGMNRIIGPFGFNNLDQHGLLIEGFDIMPCKSSNYNFPYYQELVESYGFSKEIDWVERTVTVPDEEPPKIKQFSNLIAKRYSLHTVNLSTKKDVKDLAPKLFDVYNQVYAKLYGVSQLNERQKQHLIDVFIPLVDPDLVCIVQDKEDNIVGFCITMMSLSRTMQKMKGRLYPFGFYHFLRHKKNNHIVDTVLLGVHPDHQGKGVNALLFHEINKGIRKYDITQMETTQSMESNDPIRNILNAYFEMDENRRARLYKKEIK